MPKLPEKIDDWTPPWGEDDSQLDAVKAKALLFNALSGQQKAKEAKAAVDVELTETKAKLSAAESKLSQKPGEEEAKDKEISELRAQVDQLTANGRESDVDRIARLEIALEKGLTERQAARLVGKTREELEEDADVLREELGLTDDDGEGGNDGTPNPAPQRTPLRPDQLGNGRERGSGSQDAIYSVDELRKQKADGQVTLPPLAVR